jgi:hypothetical protein
MLSAPAILRGLSGIVVNDVSEQSPSAKIARTRLTDSPFHATLWVK